MVLDDELLISQSEYKLVLEEIGNLPSNLVENGGQLFSDQPETSVSSQTDESDNSEPKPKRKKPRKICDSTNVKQAFEESQPVPSVDSLPCLVPFPGQFDFRVQLPADSSAHKWTYSRLLQKVFIDIDKVLALQFKWTVDDMKLHPEFFVRAMPVYTSHDSLKTPVTRCPIHRMPDNILNHGFDFIDHVMRCEHKNTTYMCDPVSKRYSCVTPLSPPQAGADTTTLTYKFVCKTSCLSGMNRKPISVIFTLEDGSGNEYGRQLLAIKICSCPKRDKVKEENNEMEKSQSSARFANNKSVETPTMLSVRNTEGYSHPHAEPLRDLKRVDLNASTSSSEAKRIRPKGPLTSSNNFKNKKGKESDIDSWKTHVDQMRNEMVGEIRGEFKKFSEYLGQVTTSRETNGSKFWSYIASESDQLPPNIFMEFQSDVLKTLNEKKMMGYRQNMIYPTPGPEPSLMSPCPTNEWQYRQ